MTWVKNHGVWSQCQTLDIVDPDNYKTTTLAVADQYDYMIMTQRYDESCEPICAMDTLMRFKID